jgi:DNA-binding transcriptional LysR family regulator
VTLDDLAGEPFIAQEPGAGMRMTLARELEARGTSIAHFDLVAEFGNQESVKACVAAGAGIGFVWRGSTDAELALGRLATIDLSDFRPDGHYYLVRRERRALSHLAAQLVDFLTPAGD